MSKPRKRLNAFRGVALAAALMGLVAGGCARQKDTAKNRPDPVLTTALQSGGQAAVNAKGYMYIKDLPKSIPTEDVSRTEPMEDVEQFVESVNVANFGNLSDTNANITTLLGGDCPNASPFFTYSYRGPTIPNPFFKNSFGLTLTDLELLRRSGVVCTLDTRMDEMSLLTSSMSYNGKRYWFHVTDKPTLGEDRTIIMRRNGVEDKFYLDPRFHSKESAHNLAWGFLPIEPIIEFRETPFVARVFHVKVDDLPPGTYYIMGDDHEPFGSLDFVAAADKTVGLDRERYRTYGGLLTLTVMKGKNPYDSTLGLIERIFYDNGESVRASDCQGDGLHSGFGRDHTSVAYDLSDGPESPDAVREYRTRPQDMVGAAQSPATFGRWDFDEVGTTPNQLTETDMLRVEGAYGAAVVELSQRLEQYKRLQAEQRQKMTGGPNVQQQDYMGREGQYTAEQKTQLRQGRK